MAENKMGTEKGMRDFAMGMAVYSSASVLGPLLVIGGIGYFLDKAHHGNHLILLGSIFIAFIVTNILIFRKTFAIMAELKNVKSSGKNGYDEDDEDEEDNE
jgi:F0F1-type ATP synthase assembly protein I